MSGLKCGVCHGPNGERWKNMNTPICPACSEKVAEEFVASFRRLNSEEPVEKSLSRLEDLREEVLRLRGVLKRIAQHPEYSEEHSTDCSEADAFRECVAIAREALGAT